MKPPQAQRIAHEIPLKMQLSITYFPKITITNIKKPIKIKIFWIKRIIIAKWIIQIKVKQQDNLIILIKVIIVRIRYISN